MNDEPSDTLGSEVRWPQCISLFGAAGTVGSSIAAQLSGHGVGKELFLQDSKDHLVEAHRLDLADAQALRQHNIPRLKTGPAAAGTADLVIVAASLPENPEADRRELLGGNAVLLDSLVPSIREQLAADGCVLLLTNPVDILADWLTRRHEFPPQRLLGYSLNDTARFRRAIAQEFDVDTSSVEAIVLGEHGGGQVPIFSSVKIDARDITWAEGARSRVEGDVYGWFSRYLALGAGRSSGWASGYGVLTLIQAIARGDAILTTVSTRGIGKLPETFLSLPSRWVDGGFHSYLPNVAGDEWEQLLSAAESIRSQSEVLSEQPPL